MAQPIVALLQPGDDLALKEPSDHILVVVWVAGWETGCACSQATVLGIQLGPTRPGPRVCLPLALPSQLLPSLAHAAASALSLGTSGAATAGGLATAGAALTPEAEVAAGGAAWASRLVPQPRTPRQLLHRPGHQGHAGGEAAFPCFAVPCGVAGLASPHWQ
eukprot:CAMPEP_0179032128 /NCGR_PEP_ID=MMETSP0796-20121207/11424_1 /TAXON_ID=73915 /ORGANISM="Pyrodinium bahamense, Strain pbaha01" /LENGTH=161 /DNA_ID=CAMNT_0020728337 /DNA_START=216 /DNA_END=699 /DNA_ORIENTATION=+